MPLHCVESDSGERREGEVPGDEYDGRVWLDNCGDAPRLLLIRTSLFTAASSPGKCRSFAVMAKLVTEENDIAAPEAKMFEDDVGSAGAGFSKGEYGIDSEPAFVPVGPLLSG